MNIRKTPSLVGEIIGTIRHNEIVTIKRRLNDTWYEVDKGFIISGLEDDVGSIKLKPIIRETKRRGIVKRKNIPKKIKTDVWIKYMGRKFEGKCLCCGTTKINSLDFHCAHVVPFISGGGTTVDNLRPLCSLCNLSMGRENLQDWCKKYYPDSQVLKRK